MAGKQLRSPLSQAQGLGSAREGAEHWWTQRVTAVALVPLTIWIVASLIALAGSGYGAFTLWLRSPITTVLMVLLLIALFYHMALGLQVVFEDYVHSDRMKFLTVVMVRFGCFAFAVVGMVATLRAAFSG